MGGGSNAAGTLYHYIDDERIKIVLAEAGGKGIGSGLSAATIQLGRPGIIHGAKTMLLQDEDGQILEPYSISAGLDYPGIGPMHANLAARHRATVLAINDDEALHAAFELTRLVSLTDEFKVMTNRYETIYRPAEPGFSVARREELYGGTTPQEAARIFDQVLGNRATRAQTDCVLINASFAIQAIDPMRDIESCVGIARESLESGKALATLKKFIELNS